MNDECKRATIRISSDFDARLTDIERYWNRVNEPKSFLRLIEAIDKKVIPLLQRFPALGRRLLNSKPDTVDALLAIEEIAEMTKAGGVRQGELHEYVFDNYVLLYLLSGDAVTFLSLRHTKEISFEFRDLWGAER
ncbi:type II toxin-antitoxin system RelE/ParE family toxin [Caballeronia pedi]|uniref:type II toxin-antitoxin system RelE/ParE family toxin n=1 Tax=Caballeronia pedi TaxID=1777141 RepID=UPI000772CC62|nr:type II toxin-antitoxin system RelE/ParE family toxin [Caballeronia pedi]